MKQLKNRSAFCRSEFCATHCVSHTLAFDLNIAVINSFDFDFSIPLFVKTGCLSQNLILVFIVLKSIRI